MLNERVIKYILERHCPEQGGFCFYRLEEPSGADTYYSLWTLCALGQPFSDEKTTQYLINLQHADGTYDSIFSAYYSIKGLLLLNKKPLYDPSEYILGKMAEYHIHAEHVPAEIISIFKQLMFLVDVYKRACRKRSVDIERNIQKLVLQFRNYDGGFGYLNSSLGETEKAVQILQRLNTGLDNSGICDFINKCERSDYGFTDVPGTSLSYIEHIYAGLKASHVVSYRPKYLNACSEFISFCQRRNGGFSRTIGDGIANIENTYYAVYSSVLINKNSQAVFQL